MKDDKLFSVNLDGDELILGYVKAETMADAMEYVTREYPNYKLLGIEESSRVML